MNATAPVVVLYAIDECGKPDSWEALPEVLAEGVGTAPLHIFPLTWCIVTSDCMSSYVTLQYTYPPTMVNECMAFQKHDVLRGSEYYRSNKKQKSTWPNSRTVFTNSTSTFGPQLRAPIQYTAYPNDTAAFIFWKLKNNCMVLEWNIPPSLKLLRIPKLCQAKELSSGMFYSTCITIVIVIESFQILDNPRIKGMVCWTKRVRYPNPIVRWDAFYPLVGGALQVLEIPRQVEWLLPGVSIPTPEWIKLCEKSHQTRKMLTKNQVGIETAAATRTCTQQ